MRDTYFPYESWTPQRLAISAQNYRQADPYSHIVIDEFLDAGLALELSREFPSAGSGPWIRWNHFNEKKSGRNRVEEFPGKIRRVVEELSSDRFVSFLSELVGIPSLFPDSHLIGGGIQQSERGGFLNIHSDFTGHPLEENWQRRVNLILYLNENWEPEWNGHLELWDKEMKACVTRVTPGLNRAVIFTLGEATFHGHPERIACPEGERRKSIALYYYTAQEDSVRPRATRYRARPQDSWLNGALLTADNFAVSVYSRLRQIFKFSDPRA